MSQAELDAAVAAGTLDEEAPAGDAAAGEGYLITLSPKSIKQQVCVCLLRMAVVCVSVEMQLILYI